jgi:hypothetical protein
MNYLRLRDSLHVVRGGMLHNGFKRRSACRQIDKTRSASFFLISPYGFFFLDGQNYLKYMYLHNLVDFFLVGIEIILF